jgi:hypothetical protein
MASDCTSMLSCYPCRKLLHLTYGRGECCTTFILQPLLVATPLQSVRPRFRLHMYAQLLHLHDMLFLHVLLCCACYLLLQSLRPGFRLHLYAQLGSKRASAGGSSSTCPSGDSHVIKVCCYVMVLSYKYVICYVITHGMLLVQATAPVPMAVSIGTPGQGLTLQFFPVFAGAWQL